MSHSKNALTTLQTVKDDLGIDNTDDDQWIVRRINFFSDLFERLTGRKWYYVEDHVEKIGASRGDTRLVVSEHLPIEDVDKIELKGDEIDSEAYEIEDKGLGWIRRKEGSWSTSEPLRGRINSYPMGEPRLTYEVTYTGGYVTPSQADGDEDLDRDLPYDVELAVIESIRREYNAKDRDPNLKSLSVLGDQVTFNEAHKGVTPELEDVIERYKSYEVF